MVHNPKTIKCGYHLSLFFKTRLISLSDPGVAKKIYPCLIPIWLFKSLKMKEIHCETQTKNNMYISYRLIIFRRYRYAQIIIFWKQITCIQRKCACILKFEKLSLPNFSSYQKSECLLPSCHLFYIINIKHFINRIIG